MDNPKFLILRVWLLSLLISGSSQTVPQNVAQGKSTSISSDYWKWGDKENLVDGSVTASLVYREGYIIQCNGCFTSQPVTGFWQVDLGDKYFVPYVKIVRVTGFSSDITGVSIVVSENSGGEDEVIPYIRDPNHRTTQHDLQYVRLVQYVRLKTDTPTDGMIFDEVEVYAFNTALFIPTQVTAIGINASTVRILWQPPPSASGYTIKYQYRCGDGNWSNVLSSDSQVRATATGLTGSSIYAFSVRVEKSPSGDLNTAEGLTWCSGNVRPTPVSLSAGNPTQDNNLGRERWRYDITWSMPSYYRLSCLTNVNGKYRIEADGIIKTEGQLATNYTYYTDGNVNLEIKVWSRNRDNHLSYTPAPLSLTTPTGLAPKVRPRNVGLTAPVDKCVQISHTGVEYPNAPNSQIIYQFKCTSMTNWLTIPSDNRGCSYSAYQMVSCQIRAHNTNNSKNSETATTASIYTKCESPDKVTTNSQPSRSGSPEMNNGRLRWKYTVTWENPINIKCASIRTSNPYQIRGYGNTSWTNLQSNIYELYTDGNEAISLGVKVYNNDGIGSSEKNISFTSSSNIAPQTRPRNVALTAPVDNCVQISYTEVEYPNAPTSQIVYQYQCTSMTNWQNIPSDNRRCGYLAYQMVTCEIRARNNNNSNNNKNSLSASVSNYTKCQNPDKVRSIQRTKSDSPEIRNGRLRWKYTVTWENPINIKCARIRGNNPYQVRGYELTGWNNLQTNRYAFYTDGYETISLYVRVYNNEDYVSSEEQITFTTDKLSPQTKPQNFVLTSTSSSCVRLSWNPPAYLNSPPAEVSYRHSCNSNGWRTVNNNEQVCTFSPFTEVTCLLKAINDVGNSSLATSTSTTHCAASSSPRNIIFTDQGTTINSGRVRRKYSVGWTEPEVYNCQSLRSGNKYAFKDPNGNWNYTNNSNYVIFTEGNVQVTVGVTATNNQNFVSTEAAATYTTHSFRPQKAPIMMQLFSTTPNCITMTWNPPLHPNGELQHYQYKCTNDNNWVTFGGNADARSGDRCDYNPYYSVSCRVRARNAQGWSDEASVGSIRTLCDAPSKAQDIQITYKDERDNGNRRRLRYRISWQDPATHNCIRLRTTNTFRVSSSNSNGYALIEENFLDVYADGVTNVTAAVEAFNNHNNISLSETKEITTRPMRPQTTPRAFSVFSRTFNCVTLTWIAPQYPNGYISYYQFKCTGNETWTNISRSSFNLDHCVYDVHTEVECQIKATNQVGDSDVAMENTTTLCTYPVLPDDLTSYFDQDIDNSTGTQRRRISLSLPVEDIDPKCKKVTNDGISFEVMETGINAVNTGTITDLDAVTTYSVYIMVRNDQGWQTNTTVEFETGELAPSSVPRLQVVFNSSCAVLSIKEPIEPNGHIKRYEYGCGYYGTVQHIYHTVSATYLLEEGNRVEVCGFESTSHIECMAIAVNSIGPSPKARVTGYTDFTGNTIGVPKIEAIDDIAGTVDVRIFPVHPVSGSINIRLYFVVISQQDKVASQLIIEKRSLPSDCNVNQLYNSTMATANNQTCYITAAYRPDQIISSGLVITVGSKESNLGYYNKPLLKDGYYSVHIGYQAVIGDKQEFTQFTDSTSFRVVVQRCRSPPEIDNAYLLGSSEDYKLGAQAFYQCDTNTVSGLGRSTCTETPGGLVWSQTTLVCKHENNLVQIFVGVFIPVLVIVGIICLVVYLRKRPVPPQPIPGSIEGQIADVATVRGHDDESYPPSYEDIELRFSAVSNTEYAEVADMKGEQQSNTMYENFEPTGGEEKQNQYEALQFPADACSTDDDHLYAEAPPRF